MAFDYFEDLEDFYLNLDGATTAVAAQHRIAKILGEFKIKVPKTKLREAALQELPGHVLFGWQFDHLMSLSLFAIPEDKLSSALRAAMETANFKSYAFHELSLGDERAQAFTRIDAAMGLPEHTAAAFDDIALEDRKCILPSYRVAVIEHDEKPIIEAGGFEKRFVAAYAVRRAQ